MLKKVEYFFKGLITIILFIIFSPIIIVAIILRLTAELGEWVDNQ